jgi:hypothetical protein
MIECPNCSHAEFAGALFCSNCGAMLGGGAGHSAPGAEDLAETIEMGTQPASTGMTDELEKETVALRPAPTEIDAAITLLLLESGERIALEGAAEFTLGRVAVGQPLIPEVDLGPFNAFDQGVSRLHAVIALRETQVTITDLGSANGTRVNRTKIAPHSPHPLSDGDVVSLGKLKFQAMIQVSE